VRGTTFRRSGATRLSDLSGMSLSAERTTLVRFAVALGLAAALAGAVLVARSAGSGRAAVLPAGAKTGVIVIDMSASVAGPKFERIANVIRGLVAANQGVGLVMFSDTGYELLPPNSPASALLQFERFFTPQQIYHGQPVYGQGPWSQFEGGTRISSGLVTGMDALRRAHVTHGSLLLISDLNDSEKDEADLVAAGFALKKAQIPVLIVPVGAAPDSLRIFRSLFGADAFVSASAFSSTSTRQLQPLAVMWPWALIAIGVALVTLLALNELYNTRLRPDVAA
jgi:hypothetical protein